jgi:hypothetical protein
MNSIFQYGRIATNLHWSLIKHGNKVLNQEPLLTLFHH